MLRLQNAHLLQQREHERRCVCVREREREREERERELVLLLLLVRNMLFRCCYTVVPPFTVEGMRLQVSILTGADIGPVIFKWEKETKSVIWQRHLVVLVAVLQVGFAAGGRGDANVCVCLAPSWKLLLSRQTEVRESRVFRPLPLAVDVRLLLA